MSRSMLLTACALSLAACGDGNDLDPGAEPEVAASSRPLQKDPAPSPPPPPQCSPVFSPDLVPGVQLAGPGVVYPVVARTTNQAAGPAGASTMRVEVFGYSGNAFVGNVIGPVDVQVPALGCRGAALPDLPDAPPLRCRIHDKAVTSCIVRVTADVAGQVSESRESNNVATAIVYP